LSATSFHFRNGLATVLDHNEERDVKPEQVTYPPLDVLKPVAANIWIVDSGPLRALGMPLPVRMTVIKLRDGGLLLHSPTRFAFSLKEQMDAEGPVSHILAPNSAHWTFVQEWQAHCPEARTWAAHGLRDRSQVRQSKVRLDQDLGDIAPAAWAEEIEQVVVEGAAGFREVALFHKASRTLVLTDLVQNLELSKLPFAMRPMIKIIGAAAPHGKAPVYLRTIVKSKGRQPRDAAKRLLELRPERVVFTHGSWFETDGTERLRQSLSWLIR
jgi:hypothetical protein